MAKKKIHIDELFRKGLSNLSLIVSNRDLEAIDGKKSVFEDKGDAPESSALKHFEMEVTDSDWLSTKARLDNEKSMMGAKGVFAEAFSDFAISTEPGDFAATMRKYRFQRAFRKYRWTGTGLLLLLLTSLTIFFMSSGPEQATALQSSVNELIEPGTVPENNPAPHASHTTESLLTPEMSEVSVPQNPAPLAEQAPAVLKNKSDAGIRNNPSNPAVPVRVPEGKWSSAGSTGLTENLPAVSGSGSAPLPAAEVFTQTLPSLPAEAEKASEPVLNPVNAETVSGNAEAKPKLSVQDTPKQNDLNTPKMALPKIRSMVFYGSLVNTLQTDFRVLPNSNNAFYNAIRNNGEQPGISWTKGLELGIMKGRNMFNTGLLHNSQTLQTHYRYKYKVYDSIPVRNPQGQIIGYFLFNGKDTLIDKKQSVRKSSIRIPFEYSRLFRVSSKMNLVCGLAAVLSIQTGSSGDGILNPANRQLYPYEVFSETERHVNLSPALSFGMQYALSKHLELQGGIGGSAALFSRFKNSFGASEYNYNTGINIKLLYKLQ